MSKRTDQLDVTSRERERERESSGWYGRWPNELFLNTRAFTLPRGKITAAWVIVEQREALASSTTALQPARRIEERENPAKESYR